MDWMTVVVRFALYVDLMLVFGLPLFQLHAMRKPERSSALAGKFSNLTIGATIAGVILSAISMILMVKAMSGAADFSSIEQHMIEMMLTDTPFGMAWCLRMAMLVISVLAGILLTRMPTLKFVMMSLAGGIALATLSWGGHGAMDEGVRGQLHLVADIIHLLAAGAWVGALAVFILMLILRYGNDAADISVLSRTLNGFALMGTAIVGSLLITGALNYWLIVGPTINGLFSTTYGQLLVAKLVLFGMMLLLAAANRYRLSPLLERAHLVGEYGEAIAALRRSLFIETCCAFLILALVAWLGTLGPMAE
ncbi:copper homeostasis membrane protein CopD [Herbaspirillum sp. C7C2]|jgi:putative copper resistance protein D|uniref:copper homeostasis membrane protein CopD n=1 Tax=Herbaspirillum sp. C7C2 TaxID=2736666 RepID=UPI001F516DEA|nr:copper homeostasis membrane protein CopD [Herbaspirillum sp. C7C2]MCI1014220.1 copper homeostasis membrane protein CopD [Herbaspirillum sp. C7C2]